MAESLRPDIQAAKDRMQTRVGAGREIKRLTNHLWEGESVRLMAAGRYGGGTGLVALTDRRLLFIMDGFTRQTIEDFPLDKISSVQWASGMVFGTLTVFASGNKAEIDQMDKKDGKQISDTVRADLAGAAAPPPPPTSPSPSPTADTPDVYEQLRKLGELRDLGVLTPDEFNQKKQELLARL
ncbi:PH domain-containing protein [Actinokineospora sp. NPDC004072]